MADVLGRFDEWLDDLGPAALVRREHLMPVEGRDGVFFPPTFAAAKDSSFGGGYNIDELGDGRNVCLVDSVGSQANRIEPLFSAPPYAGLVPQIVVRAGDHRVNLLDAGHRAADAIVRCAAGLGDELRAAFKMCLTGNVEPLARIAPTSLVFGAWDSRDTQAKLPRLLNATIRAYNVKCVTRSAQYVPALEYVAVGALEPPIDKTASNAYAERGFLHVPASVTHGGVIADGPIRRDVTLHLVALRRLAGTDPSRTRAVRRYVLGLALTAFTYEPSGFLRQGSNLVRDPQVPPEGSLVWSDGRRDSMDEPHDRAVEFARAACGDFGLDPDRTIPTSGIDREVAFDQALAMQDLTSDRANGDKPAKKRPTKG